MSILEISELACHLSCNRGFIKISNKGEVVKQIPFDYLTSIITKAHGITFTQNLLVRLAQHNIPLVITDQSFMPVSCVTPLSSHFQGSKIASAQANASKGLNNKLWQRIIKAKIKHQIAALKYCGKTTEAIEPLVERVTAGDRHNIEAQAAKHYWQSLFGDQFRRTRFGDEPNALLNYGYIILRSALARYVVAAGLLPSLGIHHSNQRNAFCVIDDLIEPFRPITDLTVIHCLQNGFEEINRQSKSLLTAQLKLLIRHKTRWTIVQNSMKMMAQSLAVSYLEAKDKLQIPKANYKKLKIKT